MNNRRAKKIVKKYGIDWVKTEHHFNKETKSWSRGKTVFAIPRRWKNKNVISWMYRRYGFFFIGERL